MFSVHCDGTLNALYTLFMGHKETKKFGENVSTDFVGAERE